MPCQLLQSLSAPFFGILMMTPSAQSAGTSPPSHIAAKSGWRMVAASSGSALKSSALKLLCPGAFPLLRDLTALSISSFSGIAVLMSRSSRASEMSASSSGGGLFRLSEMFRPTFLLLSFSVVRGNLCLSLMMVLS